MSSTSTLATRQPPNRGAHSSELLKRAQSLEYAIDLLPGLPPLHMAVLDADRGFGNLLNIPTRELDWEVTRLSELPRPEALTALQLDVLLVDIDTIEADVAWLSRQAMEMPKVTIVAYSKSSTVTQRVRGLQAGLDGWINRACDPHEVLARVQAIVRARRGQRVATRPSIHAGDMLVDLTRYDAIAGGRSAGMTTREFEVFALLVENTGKVLSREDIYAGVWGSDTPDGDRSVDIFVSRIRLKLRRLSPSWSYLHTHVGMGYRFEAERNLPSDSATADDFAIPDADPIAA
jgi:DNA-binding response OmpR family regulator